LAALREGLVVGGKVVIVCDVEVIEDVVLPVMAIIAFYTAVVVRLFSRNFLNLDVISYHHVIT
jgi:hypothetical protein